jgi:amidophosphoribosyltransferase
MLHSPNGGDGNTINSDLDWQEVGESCGVFGVYGPGLDVARLTYFGLFALQHRGQESAGIAVSGGDGLTVYKDLGLVAQVFDEKRLGGLIGDLAIGHNRYSTTGSSTWENAQPTYRSLGEKTIALAHNGNLSNTEGLADSLGTLRGTMSDSELMTEALARHLETASLEAALETVLPQLEGAFSLTIMDDEHLVGVRDPHGFRPLVLGRLNGATVLSSETCGLDIIGADFIREVAPGEVVIIDDDGVRSFFPFEKTPQKTCVFEFVYFSRPDSTMAGQSIHAARRRMGERLAAEYPANADVIVPVPESGIPAAQGYAAASSTPYVDGLVKNRYVGRTFISPTQQMRDQGVRMKLNPISQELEGKRVVLVDDSIVRGSTTRQLISMVRKAGALEVHLRVSSPPYRWPCYYGMDTGRRDELIAARMSTDEIADYLEVDSLGYLSLDGLLDSTAIAADRFCTACLSGDYPTDVDRAAEQ